MLQLCELLLNVARDCWPVGLVPLHRSENLYFSGNDSSLFPYHSLFPASVNAQDKRELPGDWRPYLRTDEARAFLMLKRADLRPKRSNLRLGMVLKKTIT